MSESPREPQLNTKVPGSGCFPDFQFSESELGPGICLLDECLMQTLVPRIPGSRPTAGSGGPGMCQHHLVA